MVTATDVLVILADRGIRLSLVDGSLRSAGPRGAITPELAALIREHKPALVALLGGDSIAPDTDEALRLRLEVFRVQAATPGPVPFLRLPGAPSKRGMCFSCGEPPSDTWGSRCDLCARAARIVLGLEVARP